jgi:hypothetical protein
MASRQFGLTRTAWTEEGTSDKVNVGTLQIGYPHMQALSQDKEQGVHLRDTTCSTAPDFASLVRWGLVLPRVLRLQTPLPYRGGL